MADQKKPPVDLNKLLHVGDIEAAASARLPSHVREFYNSGATDQVTVAENSAAFSKYRIRPRVLRDVSKVDMSTTLFGHKMAFPLCISPAGLQAIAHPDGELATSRACARRGIAMGISSYANHSIEQIRDAGQAVGPIPHAVQMYSLQDRALQLSTIKSAEAAGCSAILLTADSPVLGVRWNELRNDFRTPEGLSLPLFKRTSEAIRAMTHEDGFSTLNSDSHSWAKEIPWLRSVTSMQIWIKGILTAEDVELAVEYGCDGILVSNHGGRQLDGVPSTIDALPECAAAAAGRIKIHVDGGIRSGADMFKCIALGAECCWVGRPALWALTCGGEAGVSRMLNILYEDFKRCMQLAGCRTISDITKASIGVVRPDGPLARL